MNVVNCPCLFVVIFVIGCDLFYTNYIFKNKQLSEGILLKSLHPDIFYARFFVFIAFELLFTDSVL